MQYRTLLLAALVGEALASPASQQNITSALSSIQQGLANLDLAINSVNTADNNGFSNIATFANQQINILQSAQTKVLASGNLGLNEAANVANTANQLASQLMTTVTDLMAKKPLIDQAGLTSSVLQQLQQQQIFAGSLNNAVTSKVPAVAQPIAVAQGAMINSILATAITTFGQPVQGGQQGVQGAGSSLASPGAISQPVPPAVASAPPAVQPAASVPAPPAVASAPPAASVPSQAASAPASPAASSPSVAASAPTPAVQSPSPAATSPSPAASSPSPAASSPTAAASPAPPAGKSPRRNIIS